LLVERIYQIRNPNTQTVHYVAKTRSVPDQFFYRMSDGKEKSWTSWQIMQVYIPTYYVDAFTVPAITDGETVVYGAFDAESSDDS
jgi:hypothetical protein